MSNKPTPDNFAPLGPVLQALIHGSGLGLGDMDNLETLLNNAVNQYGVQLKDLRLVRTRLNPVAPGSPELPAGARQYRYDAAFPDPHPDADNELITVHQYSQRDWEAPSFVAYADAPEPDMDGFGRPQSSTVVTSDPRVAFANYDRKPRSESAKREAAKKREAEMEELAAQRRFAARESQ